MKKIKIDRNFRGNGDCAMARGNQAYGLLFDTNKEAFELTNRIYENLKDSFHTKPMVFLTGRQTKNLMGTANYYLGRIRLHNPGANVGCLIHELGHMFKASRNGTAHSRIFKACQTEIFRFWNTIKDEYFKNATDGGLSPRDQLNDARGARRRPGLSNGVASVRSFRYGERVSFTSRKRNRKVTGIVLRINQKSISVQEDGRPRAEYWRVSPNMLTKLEDKVVKHYIEIDNVIIPEPKPTDLPFPKVTPKPDPVVDTDEEIRDMVEFAIDKLSKYAVHGTLSMAGIVRTFHARGIMNTDENRAYALKIVKTLGLNIR